MARFFLSHSSTQPDSDFAKCVAGQLTLLGADVWYDSQSIRPGDYWWSELLRGLFETENFILVLSQNSWRSAWCQAEVLLALSFAAIPKYKRQVFVARIDDVDISSEKLGQRLNAVQYTDTRKFVCKTVARKIDAAEGAFHWSDLPYKELVAAYGTDVPKNRPIVEGVGTVANHERVLPPPPRQMLQNVHAEVTARNGAFYWPIS